MSQDFTTTALLASVKRRGLIPTSEQTFTTTDYLAFATEELQTYVMNLLLSANEEYGVANTDVSVTAGTATYAVPVRAANESLRNVLLSDNNSSYYPLTRIAPQDGSSSYSVSGSIQAYYFLDDSLVLVPSPTASGTVRLQYFRRPSALVATSAVATVSSVDTGRTVVTTVATIPSTITNTVTVDVVSHSPGFRILSMDATLTGTVSGTTITFSSALPATVVAGDYVCLAGESCVPQVPVEAHPLLAQRVVVKVLEALGDNKSEGAEKVCDRMAKSLLARLLPRTTGSIKYVVNPNSPGYGLGRGRWRGGLR